MPVAVVKSLAKANDMGVASVERFWKKAKRQARKAGREDDFAYVTGILKKMIANAKKEEGMSKTIVEKTLTKDEKIAVLDAKIRTRGRWRIGRLLSDPADGGYMAIVDTVDADKLKAAATEIADDLMSDMTYDDNLVDAVRAVKGKFDAHVLKVLKKAVKDGRFRTEAVVAASALRVLERQEGLSCGKPEVREVREG